MFFLKVDYKATGEGQRPKRFCPVRGGLEKGGDPGKRLVENLGAGS